MYRKPDGQMTIDDFILPFEGKLIIDATCAPADIRYPTDLGLLNEAREKTEAIVDRLYRNQESNRPAATLYQAQPEPY